MSLPTKTTRPSVATARGADLLVSTYLQGQGQATPHSARQVASFSTFICSLHMMMPPDHSSIKAFTRLWPEQGVRTRYLVLISGHWPCLRSDIRPRSTTPVFPNRSGQSCESPSLDGYPSCSFSLSLHQLETGLWFPKICSCSSAVSSLPSQHRARLVTFL